MAFRPPSGRLPNSCGTPLISIVPSSRICTTSARTGRNMASPKLKKRALFVLSQSQSPKARMRSAIHFVQASMTDAASFFSQAAAASRRAAEAAGSFSHS